MWKTKYVEVKPSEGLPTKKGEYIVVIDPESNFAGYFSFDPEDPADVEWWKETPEYWLDERPDYEGEILLHLEHFYNKCIEGKFPTEDAMRETEELLTKLKTKES